MGWFGRKHESEDKLDRLDEIQQEQAEWAARAFVPEGTTVAFAVTERIGDLLYDTLDGNEYEDALEHIHRWIQEETSRHYGHLIPLLGIAEEVGELCHAVLKQHQGIRGSYEDHDQKIRDAVGDILVFLLDFCNRYRINALAELETVWAEVKTRDWTKGE